MGKSRRVARDVFFWKFQRGTLPYDILCGVILAFIFFVPRACFTPKPKHDPGVTQGQRGAGHSVAQSAGRPSGDVPQQGK